MKTLIVYFSHPGENWMEEGLEDIKVGNTDKVAKRIAALLGADIFEVKPAKDYPHGYKACCDAARIELRGKDMPLYVGDIDVSPYEVVIVGYPIWYGTYPRCFAKFLFDHDLSKKIVLPFSTHEGSGLGKSMKDLAVDLPLSDLRGGLAIQGCKAEQSDASIKAWLRKNRLL